MHFLKLSLNYVSANNIVNVSGKGNINYLDECKTIKHFSYSSMKQALASNQIFVQGCS